MQFLPNSSGVVFGPTQALWTPSTLGSKLKAWWSADAHGTARMTDDGSGVISAWQDETETFTVTAATTARPTWAADSFNSLAGITFDGTANCFVTTSLTGLPVSTTTGEIHAMVSQDQVPGTATALVAVRYGGTAGGTARSLQRAVTAGANNLVYSDLTNTVTDIIHDFTGPHIVGCQFKTTTNTGYFDGRATSPATGTSSINTGTTRLRIGAGTAASASAFWKGKVRHVIITTELTTMQRQQLEGWLAWNSNLSSLLSTTHPFKLNPP